MCLQMETPLPTAGYFRAQDPGKYYGTSKKKKEKKSYTVGAKKEEERNTRPRKILWQLKKKKSYTVGAKKKEYLVVYICKWCFEPS